MDEDAEDRYWTGTNVKSFNFDDEDKVATDYKGSSPNKQRFRFQGFVGGGHTDHKLFVDDNVSEISYELPESSEIPLQLIISDEDLKCSE